MVGNPADDVGQIGLGIDAVHLAGFGDRTHSGSTLPACGRAAEEVVLPAEDRGFIARSTALLLIVSLPSVT